MIVHVGGVDLDRPRREFLIAIEIEVGVVGQPMHEVGTDDSFSNVIEAGVVGKVEIAILTEAHDISRQWASIAADAN
ncbi:hypothetical protein [Actinoplanes sp. NPDC049265]|uniref:hypothetical protein n=1 Tax=Actinoplanes sp. NPDC049265 TaxID=3363902 RepID=UPI0037241572